jgi:hypothetical protein
MLTSSSGGLRPKALSPFLSLISSDTFGTVVTKKLLKERRPRANILNLIVGVSTRGVPGPTSKLSLRVPAQMGRREMEHKGGGGKGTAAPPPPRPPPRPPPPRPGRPPGTAARVILRPGWMRLQ